MTDTSQEAREAIEPKTKTLREQVYSFIASTCGATDEEMQAELGMSPNTQRPRRRELVQAGRVVDSGIRRKTHTGRNAIVWVAGDGVYSQRTLF